MCIFRSRTPDAPSVQKPPQRRPGGPVASLFGRRNRQARGVFGNIFTSPLGTSTAAPTSATVLGSTSG